MASALAASLTLAPPISSFPFKPNPFSFHSTVLLPKPLFISTPMTITSAKNRPRESSSTATMDSDVDDNEDDDDEYEDEDEDFVPFKDMRRWEMSKPPGFGEGKVYDTTMEEKLLEEMERERMAQLAAEKKKAKSSPSSKKPEQQPQKHVVPSGPSVRLGNLPKKKNIHRDLQFAFKGFDGIVNISPAVTGNQKTRDPICRGFAFVELASKEAAIRFVNTYSNQDILFGKVQKKISFDIINPEQLVNRSLTLAQPKFMNSGDEKQEEFVGGPIVNKTDKEPALLMNGTSAPLSDSKEIAMGIEHLKDNKNESHVNEVGSGNLEISCRKQRKQTASKRKVVKKKSTKTSNLSLPSSMARLKIKERTVLTSVFTKYGGKVASVAD